MTGLDNVYRDSQFGYAEQPYIRFSAFFFHSTRKHVFNMRLRTDYYSTMASIYSLPPRLTNSEIGTEGFSIVSYL